MKRIKIGIAATGIAILAIVAIVWGTSKLLENSKNSAVERSTRENLLLASAIAQHGNEFFASVTRPSLVIANAYTENHTAPAELFIQARLPLPSMVMDYTHFSINGACVWSYKGGCVETNAHKLRNRADFEYFESHPDATIFVSRTYQSQRLKQKVFFVSRSLRNKNNQLAGVIRTYVDPLAFIETYKPLLKNDLSRIALVGKDGFIRARLFGDGRFTYDDDVKQRPLNIADATEPSGSKINIAGFDGVEQIISWKTLESAPLFIASATPLVLELTDYHNLRRQQIGVAGVLILAVIGIYLAFMYWRRLVDIEFTLFRQKLENAEEVNRVKTTIVSTVAHELRTPLSAIVGFTELISLMTKEDITRDYANTASAGANKLSMIIDNMLDLAKIDEGRGDKKIDVIELQSFLEKTAAFYAGTARKQSIDMLAEVTQSITIQCNEEGLSRILSNLVNNAIKFTRSGSITLRARPEGANAVVIEVEDTGIGIPQEDIPKLFERFSHIDQQRRPGGQGSGLGLSLVKELLHFMGGEISITSELNVGTRFSLWLPSKPPGA